MNHIHFYTISISSASKQIRQGHLGGIALDLSQRFSARINQLCHTRCGTGLIIDTQASLAYPASHKRHILIISISLMGKPVPFALSGKESLIAP
jgi:hypothetical protein